MPARALTVILAAGEGKRMHSILPKVLHRVGGKPLVEHLVQATLKAGLGRVLVVVGHRRDMVIEAIVDYPVEIVVQEEQRGTGHAMQMVADYLGNFEGSCLVMPGDAPFIRPETMRGLVEYHEEGGFAATVLTSEVADPTGYGRVVRNEATDVERIVEHGDARSEELVIQEVNSGVYVFDYRQLTRVLDELRADNRQRELYLTDTIAALRAAGRRVGAQRAADPIEVMGINDPPQLRDAERIYRERQPPAPPERKRPRVEIPDDDEDLKLGRPGSVLDQLVEEENALAHGVPADDDDDDDEDEDEGEDEKAEGDIDEASDEAGEDALKDGDEESEAAPSVFKPEENG